MVLAIATGWFVAYGLMRVASPRATGNALDDVIQATPGYLVLAVLLLAGLVSATVDLVKLVRRAGR
ncbi:hypothetical protein WS99_04990 [Burkholderia territorii]|uniref:hypothetical protein n=1 Tax=Burkholderia territorii TaxID=1503055 RepID=UPI0007523708|nr:hypothetical protein [Burkholderia territorii]KVL58765.1 hypothetical protein WS99_04990 [Burkholderia territorii]KWA01505.1 hypothetical protein WT36_22935 [Burkholderia territorii]KWA05657.1 hypothetical protein WT37_30155 [Burkholderia territorii]KWA23824.1 hypothetical protein WT39_24080 [Burkholderia territorii]